MTPAEKPRSRFLEIIAVIVVILEFVNVVIDLFK